MILIYTVLSGFGETKQFILRWRTSLIFIVCCHGIEGMFRLLIGRDNIIQEQFGFNAYNAIVSFNAKLWKWCEQLIVNN